MKKLIGLTVVFVVVSSLCCEPKDTEVRTGQNIEKEDKDNYVILDNVIIDETKFYRYQDVQEGILLEENNDTDNIIVEKVFINQYSKKEIYYTGSVDNGHGIFWIKKWGEKSIIFDDYMRYGPILKWHGGSIAEIVMPNPNPFIMSYFYDFDNGKISKLYDFPLYVNTKEKTVLIWGALDFELYDLENDEKIKEYDFRRISNMDAIWAYIYYYIEPQDDTTIIMFYDDWYNKKRGKFIIDISR